MEQNLTYPSMPPLFVCLFVCLFVVCVCSLLVELTPVPSSSVSGGELFHQSAEDAYESAVHTVCSPDDHMNLWREYISYMRSKVVCGEPADLQRLLDCLHRCLMDVDGCVATGQATTTPAAALGCLAASDPSADLCTDYTFHNEVC